MMIKKRGQTSLIAILGTAIGLLFTASIGISWKAFDNSEQAQIGVALIQADIASIKTDLSWIKSAIEQRRTLIDPPATTTVKTKK